MNSPQQALLRQLFFARDLKCRRSDQSGLASSSLSQKVSEEAFQRQRDSDFDGRATEARDDLDRRVTIYHNGSSGN